MIIISSAVLFSVSNVAKVNRLTENIAFLDKEIGILNNQIIKKQSRIIELESAERICTIAETKLGMKKPEKLSILIK